MICLERGVKKGQYRGDGNAFIIALMLRREGGVKGGPEERWLREEDKPKKGLDTNCCINVMPLLYFVVHDTLLFT